MIIEITGASTWNKGAELMLVAIKNRFTQVYPDIKLAVNLAFGNYSERTQYGLWLKPDIQRIGRSRISLALMPLSLKKEIGIIDSHMIDAILDTSGFAFGDQHPEQRSIDFAKQVEFWQRQKKPVILLPQALGPFERTPIRNAFNRIANASNLIFARDDISFDHARNATNSAPHVLQAPDFTNLVRPVHNQDYNEKDIVYIVPNQRMIEKAKNEEQKNAYIPFLVSCISIVEEIGLRPVILIHGRPDSVLVRDIFKELGHEVALINEENPVEIKRLLGQAYLVIASRFHALVSALSQGIPCIGTSWSHKYEMLFQDYDCKEMILSPEAGRETIRQCLEMAAGPQHAELVQRVSTRAKLLIEQTQNMWKHVDKKLGLA